ncbi:hypothetical protein FF38_09079 [Lucilia cuprina]|uniref:Uncharacterized protein n=1 Tax=Lucilia cuprina TaxID=7375 RepID=A0A0L0CNE7_LUCCU|nr:hypothetical protein FF38_09079 [Lucilia cuprina]
MAICLQSTTVGDNNLLVCLAGLGAVTFDLLNNIHAFNDLTEDNVFVVQPSGLDGTDEELRTVGVGSSIGHRQNTGTGVLQGEVLISELVAIDGFTAGTIVVCEITTLAHEVGNDTMEGGALVAETLFTGAESTEILSGLWNNIATELQIEEYAHT